MYLLAGHKDETTTVAQQKVTNNKNNSARRYFPVINLPPEYHTVPTKS